MTQEDEEADADDDRDHQPARERRPDPGEMLLIRGAMAGEPLAHVLVGLTEPADRQDEVDHREAEEHHRRDQERITGEKRDDEDADGILGAEASREPLGRPARARLEKVEPGAGAC